MSKRRFDVEALMANFMEGDTDAFESLYERYRGRIYRYVVRHCGTGEQGRLLYQKFWAGFVEARPLSPTPRHLKTSLYRILHRQMRSFCQESGEATVYRVGELVAGDDGVQWGVLLIDRVRALPYRQRESFLFRYEIGLNCAAIALVLGESGFTIEERIRSAEQELAVRLAAAGCADTTREALKSYYSETRRVKPPATWDSDVLQVLPQWLGETAPQAESNGAGMQTGLLARGFNAALRRLKSGSGALKKGLRQSVEPAGAKMPLSATNQ